MNGRKVAVSKQVIDMKGIVVSMYNIRAFS